MNGFDTALLGFSGAAGRRDRVLTSAMFSRRRMVTTEF